MSNWGDETRLAARLRDPIVIETVTLTSDGLGGNTESWSSYATTYGEVEALFGTLREQVVAEHREARAAYRVVIRRRDGVHAKMRVQWQGKILHIHAVAITRSTTEILTYEGGEA